MKTNYSIFSVILFLLSKIVVGQTGNFQSLNLSGDVNFSNIISGIRTNDNQQKLVFNRSLSGNRIELVGTGDIVISAGTPSNVWLEGVTFKSNGNVHINNGSLLANGSLRLLGSNRTISFWDAGEISAANSSHRVIFDIKSNKLELLEAGDLVFSPGAVTGVRTEKVTFKATGDVAINGGSVQINGQNRSIIFADNGDIRSLDANHRIIFDRQNNKLELLEWGDLVFSPGATGGTRTEKVTFKANGDASINSGSLSVSGSILVKNNNVVEFGNGLSKEVNAGKIGYRAFSDALDIVGAANSNGEARKIMLWAEGGTINNGPLQIPDASVIELGYRVSGKEVDAGKISYQRWSDGLDIIGAGTNSSNRKIKLWAEGGLTISGPVGIGNASLTDAVGSVNLSKYNLWVSKGIVSEDLALVNITSWKDEVFKEGYSLPSLIELEDYIHQHSHLPGLPSEDDVKKNGYSIHQINLALLEKVEQMTLYLIQQEKEIAQLKNQNMELQELSKKLDKLEQLIKK
jgi:hypothetical protein